MSNSYQNGKGMNNWRGGKAYDVTFIVTEDCNLRCKYCYQVHKNNKSVMTFDVAKKAVDYLLDNPQLFNFDSVIWNFIGGEPLLEIDLIDQISEYIKLETYKRNHKWAHNYRFSISTNGILYDDEKVQSYLNKNINKCYIGISIDGTKEKHDMQRVYKDGRGSYEDVVKNIPAWLKRFPNAYTKVTIGHDDLPYLKDSIIHLWDLGLKVVPANVVFENVWEEGDDLIFEKQLKDLADYIIDNNLWDELNCTLFSDNIGYPNTEETLNKNHCGSGKMLAVDSRGNLYPCLRYAEYSLDNKQSYSIGDVKSGIDFEKVRSFLCLSTKSQSTEECLQCEVATGCAWCQANNYDQADSDTNFQRCTYICKMHKARCRANNYYWARLANEFDIQRENFYEHKKHLFFIMSDDSVEHCNYKSKDSSGNVMHEETLKKGIEFANENFYTPVILHSKIEANNQYSDEFNKAERIDIYAPGQRLPQMSSNKIQVVSFDTIDNVEEGINTILTITEDVMEHTAALVEKLFEKVKRVNLNLKNVNRKFDYEEYENQLELIVDLLEKYYSEGIVKEINIITDSLYLDKMENCGFGENNFALAPNGKLYICPAFYFNDADSYIGTLEDGIVLKNSELFKLDKSPICKGCEAYHCSKCVFLNKTYTNEYNVPSSIQCKISHLEYNASAKLYKRLLEQDNEYAQFMQIRQIDYKDPIEKVLRKTNLMPYDVLNC